MITRQQIIQMCRMRESGATLDDVGNEFGITRERVRQLTTGLVDPRHVFEIRKANLKAFVAQYGEEILEELRAGQSAPKIATTLGLPLEYVREWLRDNATRVDSLEQQRVSGSKRNQEWTDEEIFLHLRLAAELLGFTPGAKSYNDLRATGELGHAPSTPLIVARLGWSNAVRSAGLQPNPRPSSPKVGAKYFEHDDGLLAIARLRDELGELPSLSTYKKLKLPDEPSAELIRQKHGWIAALREADERFPSKVKHDRP